MLMMDAVDDGWVKVFVVFSACIFLNSSFGIGFRLVWR